MTAIWQGSFGGLSKVDIFIFKICFLIAYNTYTFFIHYLCSQLDPMAYDVLIGPVCDNRHWTLVVRIRLLINSADCRLIHSCL